MKNFINIFVLFLCLWCVISYGFSHVHAHGAYPMEPYWSEFCPKMYMDVQDNVSYYMPDKEYWAKRKKSFEQSKHFCLNNYSYDLEKMEECFSALRSSEYRKTQEFERAQKYQSGGPIYP